MTEQTYNTSPTVAQLVRALDRGLLILETLSSATDELGVTELAERCGLDKSTVHRLLATLARRDYVRQSPHTRGYSLGLKIFELYDALQGRLGLQDVCRPFLAQLMELTDETSHLAVLSGAEIVFIDWFVSSHVVSVRTQIGRQEPAYCTALGRAILAFLPRTEVLRILSQTRLQSYTTGTPTDQHAMLRTLDITRKTGFAVDDEEFLEGVRCLAAPVFDFQGNPIAAMGISGPSTRLSKARCQKLGPVVVQQATLASKALGYRSAS
jgi:DNA-binding IclR family transcriptional regulator